ncbi:hypothetical protein TPHA_0D02300 [Tetrapisispora phaffii CBS 4417]|uniref:Chromatin modification-related protein n=1 Tax=Tetrapisispora phaffii (strain ATCC 24235 / CBS 4417 / NBRC 1672 / NRRL Y-8282 / UCD 70-5) TaxID=1071381 RepID=G8BSP7_TETPH|nr:hypothetical protein TPHA_0D02300 [Tetrapisispora phaffii CBS 4417]CCE62868.1 hypothetical protein TPHA_0D02300 [Tetrapisispora phaffii CBS 4417]
MDPSALFEQTINDVSNLQAEFKYLLEEIKNHDNSIYDMKSHYNKLDSDIQKFIKQNGSLKEYPKEAEVTKQIKNEMEKAKDIQKIKAMKANTMLYLITKHLKKLEKGVELLEDDGLLVPLEEELDSDMETSRGASIASATSTEKKRKASTPLGTTGENTKKKRQTNRLSSNKLENTKSNIKEDIRPPNGVGSTEGAESTSLATKNSEVYGLGDISSANIFTGMNNGGDEEEDKTLYCFCQSVSYGEMVACDGANCKYEWFHYGCVNLNEPPQGAWYCPDCRQELAKNTLKKKRS